jgi:hypothetical protein
MALDRTQHVLDAIDGALEDWSVSGDAMRWTPEPQEVQPIWTLPAGIQPRHAWDDLRAYSLSIFVPFTNPDALIITTVA